VTLRKPEVTDEDSESGNESDEFYTRVFDWNPDLPPPNIDIASQRVCFQCASGPPDANASIDSGANVTIVPDEKYVLSYETGTTNVMGMSGPAQACPNVKVGIPTVTRDGEPLLITIPGPSLLHTGANGLLLAHGPMQRAGFDIKMRPGNRHNPYDGGYIRIPDGRVISLRFENDLYYLPVHTPVTKPVAHPKRRVSMCALQPSPNPYQQLQDDSTDPLTCGWTTADLTTSHNAWGHPGTSKTDQIIATYPELFPKDPAYRAAARERRCPICDLMKGTRKYRKSKRMKQKQRKCANCVLQSAHLPVNSEATARVCAAHGAPKRVRFAPDTSTRTRLAEDDFLHAFQARSNLVMVIDGIDFLWASSSKTKSDPESLLEEFLRYTGVTISKIRMDAAGEFASSASFQKWCANRNIVMCSTAGYNHTMQARAEGAVRITKEHIWCMLKTANMPYKFWPWALTQFCRIYNYWPSKGHAPPWVMLGDHKFSQSLHRDLHPFGCYLIGTLPREHPLVTNTTLSDRGLEGAFLGWDLSTPTVWLWSFRLQKPVKLHDPVFYDDRFPFADPSCLVDDDTESDEDEEAYPTPPTQPRQTVRGPKPATSPTPPRPAEQQHREPGRPPSTGEKSHSGQQGRSQVEQPSQALQPPYVPSIPSRDDIRTWIRGADVPATASLDTLSDKQLGRALVHHKTILQLPKDWWIDPVTGKYTACTVLATDCKKIAGHMYLDCQIIKPDKARREGQILQIPVGKTNGNRPLHVRRLLDLRFNNPRTLGDL